MSIPYESIPVGWFAVATSDELRPGRILERRYFGREWILWRGADGAAAMQDAYCPHLGAHLGSGTVEGNSLRCPFHGFRYDSDGACVSVPGGCTPPPVRLPGLPLRETHGIIVVWWDAAGQAPAWNPPELEESGFTAFRFDSRVFRGHPQEICENSADCGHFGPTHGYGNARMLDGPRVEGHVLHASYAMERSLDFVGLPGAAQLSFACQVHGLGMSRVRASVAKVGIEADLLILPTPIDASTVQLRFGARVRKSRVPLLTPIVKSLFIRGYTSDLVRDIPIWERKRYVARPPLTSAEGPIAVYRKYARQFYSRATEREQS